MFARCLAKRGFEWHVFEEWDKQFQFHKETLLETSSGVFGEESPSLDMSSNAIYSLSDSYLKI